MFKFDLEVNLEKSEDFPKFLKEFREEIIEKGLDKPIKESLPKLRIDLKNVINQQIKDPKPAKVQDSSSVDRTPEKETVDKIPKSEKEVTKYLLGVDIDQHPVEDYTTLTDSNIIMAHQSKNVDGGAARMTLRLNINEGETAYDQWQQAVERFNNSVLAIPDDTGKMKYFVNKGGDLSRFVKIKCSTQTGVSEIEPEKGMSPVKRFEKDRSGKFDEEGQPYAEWTLKQSAVKDIRDNPESMGFAEVSDVVEALKQGDYEAARKMATAINPNKDNELLNVLPGRVDNIENKSDLNPGIQAYSSLVDLVNGLKLKKTVREKTVKYQLISSYGAGGGEVDFVKEARRHIGFWVISNSEKWVKKVVQKTKELIKKYDYDR